MPRIDPAETFKGLASALAVSLMTAIILSRLTTVSHPRTLPLSTVIVGATAVVSPTIEHRGEMGVAAVPPKSVSATAKRAIVVHLPPTLADNYSTVALKHCTAFPSDDFRFTLIESSYIRVSSPVGWSLNYYYHGR